MNEMDLKTKIEGLKKAIAEHNDFAGTYASDLEKCEQQLKDINKPELTPSQLDDVWEAVNKAIGEFDFNDSENYEIEYQLDYDGRVGCSSIDFQSTDELIDKIVANICNLFKEVDNNEELDTTEPDHHAPVEQSNKRTWE